MQGQRVRDKERRKWEVQSIRLAQDYHSSRVGAYWARDTEGGLFFRGSSDDAILLIARLRRDNNLRHTLAINEIALLARGREMVL